MEVVDEEGDPIDDPLEITLGITTNMERHRIVRKGQMLESHRKEPGRRKWRT